MTELGDSKWLLRVHVMLNFRCVWVGAAVYGLRGSCMGRAY